MKLFKTYFLPLLILFSMQNIHALNSGKNYAINTSGTHTTRDIQRKTKALSKIKPALIIAGILGGSALTYGSLYWYNSTLERPMLDNLFQKIALRRMTSLDKKYKDITSNFILDPIDIDGKTFQVEGHIYDNDALVKGDLERLTTEEMIKKGLSDKKTNKERYVLLHLCGLSVDIRIYQDMENKGKSIMGEISNRIKMPVVTMNFPPFGKSKVGNESGYYLDDNYKAARHMLNTISALYEIPPTNVILWGECLGGLTAARLAEEFDSKLVLIDAAPTNYDDILHTPLHKICLAPLKPFILKKSDYDLSETLQNIKGKVIVRHHPDDKIINVDAVNRYASHHEIILTHDIDKKRSKTVKSFSHALEKKSIAAVINGSGVTTERNTN